MEPDERFPRERRLRRRSDFDRVFRRGRRLDGRLFVLIVLPNGQAGDRLGLTVGKTVGPATVRNRARRLLREGFRRLSRERGVGYDLVVVAKSDIVERTQEEVDREFRERVRRLSARGGARGAAPATRT